MVLHPEFVRGQEIVLAEVWNAIAEIEETCSSNTGYGRAKLLALRRVVEKLDLKLQNGE